jgi:hypothetical protein
MVLHKPSPSCSIYVGTPSGFVNEVILDKI